MDTTTNALLAAVASPGDKKEVLVREHNAHAFLPIERAAALVFESPPVMDAGYLTSTARNFQASIDHVENRSVQKVAASALKGLTSAANACAEPLNFVAVMNGSYSGATSPSLVGRVSYGFKSFARRLQNVAVVLFMTATGYKIYENAKWALLNKEDLHKKIQFSTVDEVAEKHVSKKLRKELAYDYFKGKISDFLKKVKKEHGLKARLSDEINRHLDDELKKMLTDDNLEFIKDKKAWLECKGKTDDIVEAFGLYIRVMLERQSLREEIERVFGKEGAPLINKMRSAKDITPDSYKEAMSMCRQRLALDTLNFILGGAVMSMIALSVSTALAFPLLIHASEGSHSFQYMCFLIKALVLGSIIFTPHGLITLTIFNLGMLINTIAKGGISKLPFMNSKELDNCTRLDKVLIHLNVILVLFSIVSIGCLGSYGGLPSSGVAATASAQLPALGFHIFAISQIWSDSAKKRKLEELEKELLKKPILFGAEGDEAFIEGLFEKYGYDLFEQACKTKEVSEHISKHECFKAYLKDPVKVFLSQLKEWDNKSKEDKAQSNKSHYQALLDAKLIEMADDPAASGEMPDYFKQIYEDENVVDETVERVNYKRQGSVPDWFTEYFGDENVIYETVERGDSTNESSEPPQNTSLGKRFYGFFSRFFSSSISSSSKEKEPESGNTLTRFYVEDNEDDDIYDRLPGNDG